jgi:hypothetical protein
MQLSHRNYTKRSAHFNGAFQRVRIVKILNGDQLTPDNNGLLTTP